MSENANTKHTPIEVARLDFLVSVEGLLQSAEETKAARDRLLEEVETVTTQSLLTNRKAAEVLQVTSGQLARMANRGDLPSVKLPNGERRFIAADLWSWIESRREDGGQ